MLIDAAAELVEGLARGHHPTYGVGSMTCSIYDTAWISMITKVVGDQTEWLFPSSLTLILDQQHENGGWIGHGTETDVILNTAAAILALCKHRGESNTTDLNDRISRATQFLDRELKAFWLDASTTLPVGFEMLLPKLLQLLAKEGINLEFPARAMLEKIRAMKMARVRLDKLYEGHKSTLLHSLEAFIGDVDFDRLSQHKQMGSMMASPASTAAYLMNCSTWDDEAEAYLQHVVLYGAGHGSGGVPSAFPSTYFEYTWVVATLLENGFTREDLGTESLEMIGQTLEGAFEAGSGFIGFAEGMELDADDTAKGITTLNLIGSPTPASKLVTLVDRKAKEAHFRTYAGERDASITTNCNCLTSLCASPDASQHVDVIEMAMRYLCNKWNTEPVGIRDKWHLSSLYPMMLMTQGLMSGLDSWGRGVLPNLPTEVAVDAVIVAHQIMGHLLRFQRDDGSWDGERECTAYAVIAITRIASLPTVKPILSHIYSALERAKGFLRQYLNCDLEPEHLWIEKVTYGSRNLSQAFLLAAMKCTILPAPPRLQELVPPNLEATLKSAKLFRQLPMFSEVSTSRIDISLIESSLFVSRLRERCLEIFPGRTATKEKHLAYIPFTWVAGNELHGRPLGSHILLEMMVISALAYQVDEFIETSVSQLPPEAITRLHSELDTLFHLPATPPTTTPSLFSSIPILGNLFTPPPTPLLVTIKQTLSHFLTTISALPYVQTAPPILQSNLRLQLKAYLSAHLTQLEYNHALSLQPNKNTLVSPPSPLYDWLHTTSGTHTAGPLAISLFQCLLSPFFTPTPKVQHLFNSISRHLSAICRIYNDLGSLDRDREENNVNAVNFPEFEGVVDIKEQMMGIAGVERKMLDLALKELEKELGGTKGGKVMKGLGVFVSSADVYGEMYVVRDMTPRVK
ncbi:uncharacterized protein QC763_501300 [Podospora pseudopauciseta]|uniref:Uncharacterized protein n=1 Tax=Podospora pseudopauciseta TaxID=2093780 RepID=A0ABR0H7D1_9PEZI|nr:hypothetical protein QC763_501300 [Podospora pseudopauciseta]